MSESISDAPIANTYKSTTHLIHALITYRLDVANNPAIKSESGEPLHAELLRSDDAIKLLVAQASFSDRQALRVAIFNFVKSKPDLHYILKVPATPSAEPPTEFKYTDDELLKILSPVKSAIYTDDECAFRPCLEGTRVDLIHKAVETIRSSPPDKPLFLTGAAGTGKSAIATSIVKTLQIDRVPVCSFFCKHDDERRSTPKAVLPTLAWQLSMLSQYRALVDQKLSEFNDLKVDLYRVSPKRQIELLLSVDAPDADCPAPLPVLLIDALDECGDGDTREGLLEAIEENSIGLALRFVLVLVGRRTDDIERHLVPNCCPLFDLDSRIKSPQTVSDIRKYAENRLAKIARRRRLTNWPSKEEIQLFIECAGGLFVWANVACNYIAGLESRQRLQEILTGGGGVSNLYNLYYRALMVPRSSERAVDADNERIWIQLYRKVVGAILCCSEPLSPGTVADLIDASAANVENILSGLQPLLAPRDTANTVRVLRASITEYLRSDASKDFRIRMDEQHAFLATRCFEIMRQSLRFNLGNISDTSIAIYDLPDISLIRSSIAKHVQYVCLHWSMHLERCDQTFSLPLANLLDEFLGDVFFFWCEALSILDGVYFGVTAMDILSSCVQTWKGSSPIQLYDRAEDAARLLRYFREAIRMSPAHIYVSALPFAVKCSVMAARFLSRCAAHHLPAIVQGLDDQWPPELLVVQHSDSVSGVLFSPDGHTFASIGGKSMRLWDVRTGGCVHTLEGHTREISSVAFSPDGSMIATGSWDDGTARVWDARTGGCVHTLEGHTLWIRSVAFSPDGSTIATGSWDGTARVWDARTGGCVHTLEGHTSVIRSVAFSPDRSMIATGS